MKQAFEQVAADVKDGKGECMEMMRKIVEVTSVRAARDERRIQTLERALRTGGLATSVGATTQATTVNTNTVVTVVDVGGNPVSVLFDTFSRR